MVTGIRDDFPGASLGPAPGVCLISARDMSARCIAGSFTEDKWRYILKKIFK